MIKKLRVTVDGKPFEVTVEVADEPGASAAAPPPAAPAGSAAAASPVASPMAKTSAAPGDVTCPLGGRVVAIDAKPGQEVKEGDRLLTVETMKMNTFVCAHKAGRVAEVLVSVGDAVEEGRILARIASS